MPVVCVVPDAELREEMTARAVEEPPVVLLVPDGRGEKRAGSTPGARHMAPFGGLGVEACMVLTPCIRICACAAALRR